MDQEALVRVFKALSNPNRLRLFHEIRREQRKSFEHSCSLRSVMSTLSIGAPTVSHHLRELVNAGLVLTERDGKFVRCSVNESVVAELGGFFRSAT